MKPLQPFYHPPQPGPSGQQVVYVRPRTARDDARLPLVDATRAIGLIVRNVA